MTGTTPAAVVVRHRRQRLPRREAVRQINLLLDAVSGAAPTLFAAWLASLLLMSTQSAVLTMLVALGFAGAFVAGLVGVGGAIVMIPLLLYIPPLVGIPALGMHVISGITMVQVAAAGVTGMLAHRHVGHVDAALVASLGGAMTFGALLGALLSGHVSAGWLSAVFASLAAIAAVLMLTGHSSAPERPEHGPPRFSRSLAVAVGGAVGLLVGMVGAGGGFLLVPLMMYVLHVPVRTAVGSSLAIVALAGLSGAVGKGISGQIDWVSALALVVGALPGARLGATASRRVPANLLARILGGLVALIALRMWWNLLAPQ